jgi:hypothetical protein
MRPDVAGVCRFCGCSEFDPCAVEDFFDVVGCSWTDRGRRVCSVCAPASKAEGHALTVLRRVVRPMTPVWRVAFHRGFIVGWFAVSPRSPYGRNPYRPRDPREAWQIGQRHGAEARRQFVLTFGAVQNRPRRFVLTGGRHAVRADRRRGRRRLAGGLVAAHPPAAR